MRCACIFLAVALLAVTSKAEQLPPWTPGTLDIHHLNTGQGNATFFVLPDATTLLVDAGDAGDRVPGALSLPDDSRSAGEWIARYVRHISDAERIDYAVVTHFHGDHMGFVTEGESKPSKKGDYLLSGITEVAEHVQIGKLLDRGWPDYDYPAPITHFGMENYRRFQAWQTANTGLSVERFRPGVADQIVLVHDPASYPELEIRNLAANGEIWTGRGTETEKRFPNLAGLPQQDWPSENMCSVALRVSYGKFDYYTGGDLPGWPEPGTPSWWDLETPIARAIGEVDVQQVNHHGSIDPSNPFFLATLRPRVHVIPAWAPSHPAPVVLKRLLSERIYPGPRDVFATEMREPTKLVIGPRAARLAGDHGHVVIRVHPRVESYMIYVLGEASYRVRTTHGPYQAR